MCFFGTQTLMVIGNILGSGKNKTMFKTNLNDTNYRAKVVKLGEPKKHPNADKLQIFTIDYQSIITDLSYKQGDNVIYFPLECVINKGLISYFNGFSDAALNRDKLSKGFFNNQGRVRAVRLRQEASEGFVLKLKELTDWLITNNFHFPKWELDQEFDSYNDLLICNKYVPVSRQNNERNPKQKQSVKGISRLVDGQFRLHNDTENLRRNIEKLHLTDIIGIHYKKHGTSFVVGNILVNKNLNWKQKILLKLGVDVNKQHYDIVYSSRKVVKNEYETQNTQGYYDSDIWGVVAEELRPILPKGFTVYGEILGYTATGGVIQSMNGLDYDYGCEKGEHKTYIYRVTQTNEDGFVTELTDTQIKDFCKKFELNYADTFYYYGTVLNYLKEIIPNYDVEDDDWRTTFIKELETIYNEKDCWMCKNKLPEEGIVVRVNKFFGYEAYKLKSFKFLEGETKQLDTEQPNIEDQN